MYTDLEGLVRERLFHLGGLLLAPPQPVVVQPLELPQLPLPHLLLLLVNLEEKNAGVEISAKRVKIFQPWEKEDDYFSLSAVNQVSRVSVFSD